VEENAASGCNSSVTALRQPTTRQLHALDAMFEGNRHIYNRMVAFTRSACARRDSLKRIRVQTRPVSQKGTQVPFSASQNAHKLLQSLRYDVGESAYNDFIGGLSQDRQQYYALRASGSEITYSVMRFRRLMAHSNSIALRTKRGFNVTTHDGGRISPSKAATSPPRCWCRASR
jgi:hypothetical protein